MRPFALVLLLSLALVCPALAAPVATALDSDTFILTEETANGTLVQVFRIEGGRAVLQSALTTRLVQDRSTDRMKVVTQELEIERKR